MADKTEMWARLLKSLEGKRHTVRTEKDGGDALVKWGGIEAVIPVKDGEAVPVEALASSEEAGFELDFTISTADVDRDNDTINQAGWKLGSFEAAGGPVLFAHNRGDFPIAKAVRTFVENSKLRSVARFPSRELNPRGNTAGRLALHGFGMKGASVGFIPLVFAFNEERGSFAVDFDEQELLEWSVVPIPANPAAVQGAKSFGIDLEPVVEWATEWLDGAGSHVLVPRALVEGVLDEAKGNPVSLLVTKGEGGAFSFAAAEPREDHSEEKRTGAPSPVPAGEGDSDAGGRAENDAGACALCADGVKVADGYHVVKTSSGPVGIRCAVRLEDEDDTKAGLTFRQSHPQGTPKAAEDTAWSGPREVAAMPNEAAVLRRYHAFVDDEGDPDAKVSYKAPHHRAEDGAVVLRGVNAMIAVSLGARGGFGAPVTERDRRVIYEHGAAHLRQDFDREPPEFRAYTQGELRELFPDVFKMTDADLAAVKGAEKTAGEPAGDSEGLVPDPAGGDDVADLTVEDVERLADEAFNRAKDALNQATTGELADF